MDKELSFHRYKISRLISARGESFTFVRNKLNDYKEPIDGEYDSIVIKGFYHETNSYVSASGADSSVIRTKPQPQILCTNEEAEKVEKNDQLEYKGTKYKVVDKTDPLKFGICFDISLEVVQDGK